MADSPASSLAVAESAPVPDTPVAPTPLPIRWSVDELRGNLGWAVLTTTTLLVVFLVLRVLPTVGWPLVLAAIFSYLFDPLVTTLARRGLSRTLTTSLLLGACVLVVGGGVFALLPLAIDQASNMPEYLQQAVVTLAPHVKRIAGIKLPATPAEVATFATAHAQELLAGVGAAARTILGGSLSVLSFLLGAFIVPVVAFFLLRSWPDIVSGAASLVPTLQRPAFEARMLAVDRMLGGFIRGQLIMAVVLSLLYSTALSIIGLKLAIVVGLATGFGNLVPYVGTATGVVLASAFCLVDFGPDYHLLLVVVTYAVLVTADSIFITPRIVGDKVGLSPAAVIVAVSACGALFGFAGVLLAVPSAAILKLVAGVCVQAWRQSRWYGAA